MDMRLKWGLKLKWELTLHLSTTQMGGVIAWLRHLHHMQVMLLGRQCLYGIMRSWILFLLLFTLGIMHSKVMLCLSTEYQACSGLWWCEGITGHDCPPIP